MPTFIRNSIFTRIQDLVGSDVSLITGYKDIINTGFNAVVDLIPVTSELWKESVISTQSSFLSQWPIVSDVRVIMVTRTDSDGIKRVCREVPFDILQRGEDSSSIYFNGGDFRNPIYSFDDTGRLVIQPTPDDTALLSHVHFFPYLLTYDLTDSGELDGSKFNFPKQALYLGILKASSHLLQARVSQAVQEEEDSELLSLLQTQSSSIDKAIQEESQRLGMPHHLIGDGNEID